MILLIHSLLVIISVVCLTAANIRIIPEMAKEFEENIFFYSKSAPKCCSFRYNVLKFPTPTESAVVGINSFKNRCAPRGTRTGSLIQ